MQKTGEWTDNMGDRVSKNDWNASAFEDWSVSYRGADADDEGVVGGGRDE